MYYEDEPPIYFVERNGIVGLPESNHTHGTRAYSPRADMARRRRHQVVDRRRPQVADRRREPRPWAPTPSSPQGAAWQNQPDPPQPTAHPPQGPGYPPMYPPPMYPPMYPAPMHEAPYGYGYQDPYGYADPFANPYGYDPTGGWPAEYIYI